MPLNNQPPSPLVRTLAVWMSCTAMPMSLRRRLLIIQMWMAVGATTTSAEGKRKCVEEV